MSGGHGRRRAARLARARSTRGFTLVEVMVVLVVAATLATVAALSLTGLAARGATEQELLRLQARLGLALQRATLEGRELGLSFSREGYAFAEYEGGAWWPLAESSLGRVSFAPGLAPELRLEGAAVVLPDAPREVSPGASSAASDDGRPRAARPGAGAAAATGEGAAPPPQVLVLSDGTVTPFDLGLRDPSSGATGWLEVGLLGDARLVRGEGAP